MPSCSLMCSSSPGIRLRNMSRKVSCMLFTAIHLPFLYSSAPHSFPCFSLPMISTRLHSSDMSCRWMRDNRTYHPEGRLFSRSPLTNARTPRRKEKYSETVHMRYANPYSLIVVQLFFLFYSYFLEVFFHRDWKISASLAGSYLPIPLEDYFLSDWKKSAHGHPAHKRR